MDKLCSRVVILESIINEFDLSLLPSLKKYEIAIYDNGYLYFKDYKRKFSADFTLNCDFVVINKEDLLNDDVLNAGRLISEMYTKFFYENKDERIPNDLLGLDYPNNYLNYDYMRYERTLLSKAFLTNDLNIKRNFIRMFLNVRDLRCLLLGEEFTLLENKLETICGLAQYAVYDAIYHYDKKRLKEYFKLRYHSFMLENKNLFGFRHANMYSGLILLVLLKDLGFDVSILYQNKQTIMEFAKERLKYINEPISFKSDKNLFLNWKKYEKSLEDKITLFFDNNPLRVSGSFQIYAYDQNKIFKNKENIYHESFVVLKNLLTNELIKLDGPVITKIMKNSIDIVQSYYILGSIRK